jgi:hypothetical protein
MGRQARSSSGLVSVGLNLETKIKMLNNVGVVKKSSPMAAMTNYFTNCEELTITEALPVSIII